MRCTRFRELPIVAIGVVGIFFGTTTRADPYPWTISQVQGLTDVTPAFHGGAGQLSTIDSITPIPTGIQLEVTYRIGQDSDPLGPNYGLAFARVSLESCCFNAPGLDLSAFTSSSFKITTSIPLTAQSFLYTDFTENGATIDDGDATPGESFSQLFWEHNDGLPAGGPTDVDVGFSNVTEFDGNWNLNNPQTIQGANAVRGWGIQLANFGGMTIGNPVQAMITIEGVVPEPSSLTLLGLLPGALVLRSKTI